MSKLQKFLDDDPTLLKEITAEEFETVKNINSDKKVSIGVLEQVMWERDVAIDQLKELGYGLGQKIEKLADGDRAVSLNAVLRILNLKGGSIWTKIWEVKQLPSVSQTKKGYWIKHLNSDKVLKVYQCSNCGNYQGYKQKFCEECGTDMREDDDNNGR